MLCSKWSKNPKNAKILNNLETYFFSAKKISHRLSILGLRNSTTAFQLRPILRRKKVAKYQRKNWRKKKSFFLSSKNMIFLPKKCHTLSFSIFGGHNLTRALQERGLTWSWQGTNKQMIEQTEILMSNIGLNTTKNMEKEFW